jgi:O-succinylbenzoic acid--CoA ligase
MSEDLLSVYRAAEDCPGRLAVRDRGTDITFARLAELVRENGRRFGAEKPACLPLRASGTLPVLLDIYWALAEHVPIILLHPGLTEPEVQKLKESFEAGGGAVPEGIAAVLFTSGTSGRPKAAMISRRALLASARSSAENIALGEGDVWQLSISPARIGGFSILTRSLIARSAVSLAGKFSAEDFPRRIEEDRVTLTSIVPTMLSLILDKHPEWQPPEFFRALLLGGSAASDKLKRRASANRIPVIITYGMTETASNVVTTRYADRFEPTVGCGKPNAGVGLRIAGGQIEVRGPMRMEGYLGRAPLACDEWFATGDIGFVDAEGFVHVQARRCDVILTGGENVYPVEVEQTLEQISGIKSALVVGAADETWGAVVTAFLVAEDKPLDDASLIAEIRRVLAPYKSPRRIAWVESLPQNAAGKPDRTAAALAGVDFRPLHYRGTAQGGAV